MSRIGETFASLKRLGRAGFIPFVVAGDPDLATTERLLIELAAAGANIIELGVPFSDPVADGEVIQRASETVHLVFHIAERLVRRLERTVLHFQRGVVLLHFLEGLQPRADRCELLLYG